MPSPTKTSLQPWWSLIFFLFFFAPISPPLLPSLLYCFGVYWQVCVCIWRPETFPQGLSVYQSFEIASLNVLEIIKLPCRLPGEPQRSTCLCLPSTVPVLLSELWGLNLGPHACVTSMVWTKHWCSKCERCAGLTHQKTTRIFLLI